MGWRGSTRRPSSSTSKLHSSTKTTPIKTLPTLSPNVTDPISPRLLSHSTASSSPSLTLPTPSARPRSPNWPSHSRTSPPSSVPRPHARTLPPSSPPFFPLSSPPSSHRPASRPPLLSSFSAAGCATSGPPPGLSSPRASSRAASARSPTSSSAAWSHWVGKPRRRQPFRRPRSCWVPWWAHQHRQAPSWTTARRCGPRSSACSWTRLGCGRLGWLRLWWRGLLTGYRVERRRKRGKLGWRRRRWEFG